MSGCGANESSVSEDDKEKSSDGKAVETAAEVDYPTSAITLMVPFAAGGGTDLGFRTLAPYLEKELGVPINVVNKPGGSGWVGWGEMLRAKPDGYMIAAINGIVPGYLNPSGNREETLESFEIIANNVYDPSVIAIQADEERFTNINELIEYAKENELTAAATGVGTDDHFAILMLNKELGTKFVPVQTDGQAQALTSVLGGHIDVLFANVGESVVPQTEGQIKVLAVLNKERITQFLPEIPTFEEEVGTEIVMGSARGLGGMAGFDPQVKEILVSALETAMNDPEYIKAMEKMGLNVEFLGPEEFTELLKEEENTVTTYMEDLGW